MIICKNLSKVKTNLSQPVYKETLETVWEKLVIHHMVCLGLRGLKGFKKKTIPNYWNATFLKDISSLSLR